MSILLIGPSRAGKSYLAAAFKEMGLQAVDADKNTDLIMWYSVATGKRVGRKAIKKTKEWLNTHHFLMDMSALNELINSNPKIILLAHCWNIMDCLGSFDQTFYMSLSKDELERRFLIDRPDHSPATEDELEFFRERHAKRSAEAKKLGIPFIDASRSPEQVYNQLIDLGAKF